MAALMTAALNNDFEMTELLLGRGADISRKNNTGETVLMCAVVIKDNPEFVKLLLASGAQIDKQDNDGMIALGWAVLWGTSNVAKFLIDKGADIDMAIAGIEKYNSRNGGFVDSETVKGIKILKDMKK